MKIRVDKEGFEDISGYTYIYKRDVFRIGSNYYKFNIQCSVCGEPYFTRLFSFSTFCGRKCAMNDTTIRSKLSLANKGRVKSKEECINISIGKSKSKGGVCKKDIPLYDTFAHNLSLVEETRFVIDYEGIKVLQVRCSYCNEWFTPTQSQCENRVQFIRGHTNRESRFYCSDTCKALCPVFFKRKWPTGYNPRKHRNKINEYDLRIWSKEVLKRANYLCEYCGNTAEHAHHIQPKKLEPFFALDPDNGIACCEECHYKYGHINKTCTSFYLSNIDCVQHD